MSRPAFEPEPGRGVLFPRPPVLFPEPPESPVPRPRAPRPAAFPGPGSAPARPGALGSDIPYDWRADEMPAPAPGRADDTYSPRLAVAFDVSDAVRDRYGAAVQAVGVQGAVAHGDDTDPHDVEIIVVMRRDRDGPAPATRRVNGIIVDVAVVAADEYLRHARTLTTSWPLVADHYLTTRGLHDPEGWLPRLRDVHLTRLAQADGAAFATLAREAWCQAAIAHGQSRRMAESYETGAAMVVLAQARVAVAIVDGLLTRTYFRSPAHAVRLAGVASAHVHDLGDRLAAQSAELTRRGRPVDGTLADLLQ